MTSEPPPAECGCQASLKDAVITPDDQVPASLKEMLTILRK
jgi:5'-methylthioadenosine phosphorylase